jgi:hypothetical protein
LHPLKSLLSKDLTKFSKREKSLTSLYPISSPLSFTVMTCKKHWVLTSLKTPRKTLLSISSTLPSSKISLHSFLLYTWTINYSRKLKRKTYHRLVLSSDFYTASIYSKRLIFSYCPIDSSLSAMIRPKKRFICKS